MAKCGTWFGTLDKMQWIETPLSGASLGSEAWSSSGTTLNGGGYSHHSWGSHKMYTFEWRGSSAPESAQLMKSYRDGTFGRGLIYFQLPTLFDKNVLPARLADPSMACYEEGPSFVRGFTPESRPVLNHEINGLPVRSAHYDFSEIRVSEPAENTFVPIPEGYSLLLGAFYESTGGLNIVAQEVLGPFMTGTKHVLPKLSVDAEIICPTRIDHVPGLKGVFISLDPYVNKSHTLTATAMVGRLIKTSDIPIYGPWTEIDRNYLNNPSFVGSGSRVEVARNVLTNPRFKPGTSQLEVYRNYFRDPGATNDASRAGWAGTSPNSQIYGVNIVAPWAESGRAMFYEWTNRTVTTGDGGVRLTNSTYPAEDAVWTGRMKFTVSHASTVNTTLSGGAGSNRVVVASSGSVSAQPGQVYEAYVTFSYSEIAGDSRIAIQPGSGSAVNGYRLEISDIDFYPGEFQPGRKWFSGSHSPYDYLTSSWVGGTNNSESILQGLATRNISGGTGRFLVSGDDAIHIIGTGNTNDVAAGASLPIQDFAVGKTYTVMGTLHVPEGLKAEGSYSADRYPRAIYMLGDRATSARAPEGPGTYDLRLVFTATSSHDPSVRFGGGGGGYGDTTTWTNAAIVEGVYNGPPFNGASGTVDDDFEAEWVGTEDNSASILTGEAVPGVTGYNAYAVHSDSFGGSVRLIPNHPTDSGIGLITIPTDLRTGGGTAMVTLNMKGPIQETASQFGARQIRIHTAEEYSNQAPNEAGSTELKVSFGDLSGPNYQMQLRTGAVAGGGDTWWSMGGLFRGTYDGPWFDGNHMPSGSASDTRRVRFTGTENNSPSVYETRTRSGNPGKMERIQKGPWVGGMGHSGCRFEGVPTYVANTGVNGGQAGYAATFREIGSWDYI